ncbi:hypothetical protein L0F63_006391 [Massospora cicadina]|nr:hypothetical protein L0F63_006391 [Massospora cicadina]
MVTFAEMLRRWERINIVEVASEAMEVTKEEYFVSQRDQMSDGLLKTGGNITPMYAASTIKKKKKKGQETSHVTLEDTGGFKKDFFMDVFIACVCDQNYATMGGADEQDNFQLWRDCYEEYVILMSQEDVSYSMLLAMEIEQMRYRHFSIERGIEVLHLIRDDEIVKKQYSDVLEALSSIKTGIVEINNLSKSISVSTGGLDVLKATRTEAEKLIIAENKLKEAQGNLAVKIAEINTLTQIQKKANKEAATESLGLAGAYKKLSDEFVQAAQKAKNLASVDLAKGLKTFSKETQEAMTHANGLNTQLKAIDAGTGQYTRNVGNYTSATFALSQILREAPSFAFSMQTGLLAISNNMPILFDEFKKLSAAIDENTGKQRGAAKSLGILAGSLLSWTNLLTIGVSLLVFYGKDLGIFFDKLIKGNSVLDESKMRHKALAESLKETNHQTVINQFNGTVGKSAGAVTTLLEAEKKLIDQGPAYIKMQLFKAAAEKAYDDELESNEDKAKKDAFDAAKGRLEAEKLELEAAAATQKAIFDNEKETYDKRADALAAYTLEAAEREQVLAFYQSSRIDQEQYELVQLQIKNKYDILRLQSEADTMKKIIDLRKLKGEDTKAVEDKLLGITKNITEKGIEYEEQAYQIKLRGNKRDETDANKKAAKSKRDAEALAKDLRTLYDQLGNLALPILDIIDSSYERQKQALKEQISLIDERAKTDVEAIKKSTASEQEKADKIANITAQAESQKKILDDARKRADNEKARNDKLKALFDIGANTAINVVKAGFNPILIALAVAVGVAQAAAVAAKPIPQYKHGRKGGPAEFAYVGDGGVHEVIEHEGQAQPTQDTLIYLLDDQKRSYRVNDVTDGVEVTSIPTPLGDLPSDFEQQGIEWARSKTWHGVITTFTPSFLFVRDGAKIIRHLFYNKLRNAFASIVVQIRDNFNVHRDFYVGQVDFSTIGDAQGVNTSEGVSVGTVQSGLNESLAKNRATTYEIPIDVPEAINVTMDGINLYSNVRALKYADTIPAPDNSVQCNVRNEHVINIGMTIPTTETRDEFRNESRFVRLANGDTGGFPVTYNIPITADVQLYANERAWFIFDSSSTAGTGFCNFPTMDTQECTFVYKYRKAATVVKWLEPMYVFSQLIKKITNDKYTAYSDLLTSEISNFYMTGGDAIRAFEKPVLKISLDNFMKSYNVPFPLSLSTHEGRARIEREGFAYNQDTIADLGEVSSLDVTLSEDHIYNRFKIGWPEQNYNNINGIYEFNTNAVYGSSVINGDKEFDGVSHARADCFGIEFLRINLENKKTTDDSGDSASFILDALPTGTNTAIINRPADIIIEGLPNAETVFNIRLSPARCMRAHGAKVRIAFYGSNTTTLEYITKNKNAEVKTTQGALVISEKDDISDQVYVNYDTATFQDIIKPFQYRTQYAQKWHTSMTVKAQIPTTYAEALVPTAIVQQTVSPPVHTFPLAITQFVQNPVPHIVRIYVSPDGVTLGELLNEWMYDPTWTNVIIRLPLELNVDGSNPSDPPEGSDTILIDGIVDPSIESIADFVWYPYVRSRGGQLKASEYAVNGSNTGFTFPDRFYAPDTVFIHFMPKITVSNPTFNYLNIFNGVNEITADDTVVLSKAQFAPASGYGKMENRSAPIYFFRPPVLNDTSMNLITGANVDSLGAMVTLVTDSATYRYNGKKWVRIGEISADTTLFYKKATVQDNAIDAMLVVDAYNVAKIRNVGTLPFIKNQLSAPQDGSYWLNGTQRMSGFFQKIDNSGNAYNFFDFVRPDLATRRGLIGYGDPSVIGADGSVQGAPAAASNQFATLQQVTDATGSYIPLSQKARPTVRASQLPTTDSITEGSTNKYYTDTRARSAFKLENQGADTFKISHSMQYQRSVNDVAWGGNRISPITILGDLASQQIGQQTEVLLISAGMNGAEMAGIYKLTPTYITMQNAVSYAKQYADSKGKNLKAAYIAFVHGETDAGLGSALYAENVRDLRAYMTTDIKAITGQSEDPMFILSQIGWSYWSNASGTYPDKTMYIANEQIKSLNYTPSIRIATPGYIIPLDGQEFYAQNFQASHYSGDGCAQLAWYIHKAWIASSWPSFKCTSATLSDVLLPELGEKLTIIASLVFFLYYFMKELKQVREAQDRMRRDYETKLSEMFDRVADMEKKNMEAFNNMSHMTERLDRYDREHAQVRLSEADMASLRTVYNVEIDSLRRTLGIKEQMIQSIVMSSTTSSRRIEPRVDTVFIDSNKVFKLHFADKWLTVDGLIGPKSYLDYMFTDSLVFTTYRKKSGNGRKGVNNNYAGIQADGARWPAVHDAKIIGTVIKKENVTGKERIFVAFESYTDSLDFTIENITRRGLYIGGTPFKFHKELINSPTDLMIAYKKEWVIGSSKYAVNESELKGFISMYRQSEIIFT